MVPGFQMIFTAGLKGCCSYLLKGQRQACVERAAQDTAFPAPLQNTFQHMENETMPWDCTFNWGWKNSRHCSVRKVTDNIPATTSTWSYFLPRDTAPSAGEAGMCLLEKQLCRQIGRTGKASSSTRCLSSCGCSGRQDFPMSTPMQNPTSAAHSIKFQMQVPVVSTGKGLSASGGTSCLAAWKSSVSIWLMRHSHLRQLKTKVASPQFFPSQGVRVPTYCCQ